MVTTRRHVSHSCLFIALGLGCLVAASARADLPTMPEARAKVVGQRRPLCSDLQPDQRDAADELPLGHEEGHDHRREHEDGADQWSMKAKTARGAIAGPESGRMIRM